MHKRLHIVVNDLINHDIEFPLELFFDEWLSNICAGSYTLTKFHDPNTLTTSFFVHFDKEEDLIIIKLTDLPPILSKYILIK